MLSEQMMALGKTRSVIREIFEYGNKRKQEHFMEELQTQLILIIRDVQANNSTQKITSQVEKSQSSPSARNGVKSSGRSTSKQKVNIGDKCPLCGKGTVRKGPYGIYCSEYKNSGCKFRG